MDAQIARLQLQLADARARPWTTLKDYAMYRLLGLLARLSPPLPVRMAARFGTSAARRNPKRSIQMRLPVEYAAGGRLAQAAEIPALRPADPKKRTILIVSHEASRTGAPILALNIAQRLATKYNVVNVILGGGPLREDFRAACVAMYELNYRTMSEAQISAVLHAICERHQLAYALVNSAESRGALPGIKAAGVPLVALLHEFAAYTRPETAFAGIFATADQVVFSTRITLENALEQYGITRGSAMHILPQGKCVVPLGDPGKVQRERQWLDSVLRPRADGARDFVVLGAGTIEPRKALELFIECATRVIGAAGGGRFRFVWIGSGYDPHADTFISAYVADQIKRAGIGEHVSIIRPTSEIEHAYALADVFLLSSRLDPLPNVAIDALVAGTPVLCFERTTGIADILLEEGLGEACVARYLDTADMAHKLTALAADPGRYDEVATQAKEVARRRFDFDRYVEALDTLASGMLPAGRQMADDAAYIRSTGRFRTDFFLPPAQSQTDEAAAVGQYLAASRSGAGMRKPMPGFNPGIFAQLQDGGAGADPFVRFLRGGMAEGPWTLPVIDAGSPVDGAAVAGARVALHLHVSQTERIAGLCQRLRRNAARPDLFVSAATSHLDAARAALAGSGCAILALEAAPGTGGEIAPLLTTFGPRLAGAYDIVGHLHIDGNPEGSWDFQLETLVGGAAGGAMLDRILTAMAGTPDLGLVYADDPEVGSWGACRSTAENLAARLGLRRLPDQIDFPAGGMFWIRGGALRRLLALGLTHDDFPAAARGAPAAVEAAIVRLLGVVPGLDGWRSAVVNVHGVTH